MYKEKWSINGVKKVKFDNDEGDIVEGIQIFYNRSPYDETERSFWAYGGICPSKPQWLSGELAMKLLKSLSQSIDNCVYACFAPQGRFNKIVDFQPNFDEEINIDDIDSSDDV